MDKIISSPIISGTPCLGHFVNSSVLLLVELWDKLREYIEIIRINIQWFLLGGYYERLILQAYELYRTSELYRERFWKYGPGFANRISLNDEQHFFQETKKLPWKIRRLQLRDWLLGRKPVAYTVGPEWLRDKLS